MTNEDIIKLAHDCDIKTQPGFTTLHDAWDYDLVHFYRTAYATAIKDAADYLASIHSGNFHSLATEIKQHFGVEQ